MSNLYLTSSCAAQDSPQRGLKPGWWYLAVIEASWRRHSDWQEPEQLLLRLGTSHLEEGREMLGKSCCLMEVDSTTERKQRLEKYIPKHQSNSTPTPFFVVAQSGYAIKYLAMGSVFRSRWRKITRFALIFRKTCLSREQGVFLTIFDSHWLSI